MREANEYVPDNIFDMFTPHHGLFAICQPMGKGIQRTIRLGVGARRRSGDVEFLSGAILD